MIKKRVLLALVILSLIILPFVSAELEIKKEAVIDSYVPEIGQKAAYDLTITNNGKDSSFSIYSLVGVDIFPNETFFINKDETVQKRIEIVPQESVISKGGTFNFIYKIKSSSGEIQEDSMLIKIVHLRDAIEINSYNINFGSDKAVVYAKNRLSLAFPSVKAKFHSEFFDFEKTFSLDPYERTEFETNLNKDKMKTLVAGSYIITTDIETYNVKEKVEDSFRFSEKEEITTEETSSGFLIHKTEIRKINKGNLPTLVQVVLKKNIISRLFTTFNIEPAKAERQGFVIYYTFQKEINPAETYTVRASTSWLYPFLLILAVVLIGYLAGRYVSSLLVIKKRTTFVKTKGGEFALKISLSVRARKFVEKIKIIDKIPELVKIHERFGINEPDRIDEKNRRLEWNIDSLQPEEERIFSYIIYSKIAPIGKFEIPEATGVYEREGKIHETSSNKVFFITEPRKQV